MTASWSDTMAAAEVYKDRPAWLEARRTGIGGSDAASILGINPFSTPLEVYLSKVGQAQPREETEAMEMGQRLQDLIADIYSERTERTVINPGRFTIVRHDRAKWHIVSPDGLIEGDPDGNRSTLGLPLPAGPGALEVKVVGPNMIREWGDEPPVHVLAQLDHAMSAMDYGWGSIVALLGGVEVRVYDVERSHARVDRLRAREAWFWRQHVMMQRPPPATTDDYDLVKRMWAATEGKTTILPPEARAWHVMLEAVNKTRLEAEKHEKAQKTRLMEAMGDAEVGIIEADDHGPEVMYSFRPRRFVGNGVWEKFERVLAVRKGAK